jgi:ribosome-associated protein
LEKDPFRDNCEVLLNTLEFAHTIVTALEERKGEDILLLDINEISIIADYFVICSGTSPRMLDALLDSVVKDIKATYKMLPRSEGSAQSGWVLVDYGSIVVHLFSLNRREYYNLEDLWREGRVVLHLQ